MVKTRDFYMLFMHNYSRSKEEQDRYENTDRLISAAYNGLLWEVKKYIPISNVDGFESKALKVSIERGHIECAQALIPHTSPVWLQRFALRTACKSDQTAMIDLLVPHTRSHEVSRVMAWLLDNNREQTARDLLPHVDKNDVVQILQRFPNGSEGLALFERLQAHAQKQIISEHLEGATTHVSHRKM